MSSVVFSYITPAARVMLFAVANACAAESLANAPRKTPRNEASSAETLVALVDALLALAAALVALVAAADALEAALVACVVATPASVVAVLALPDAEAALTAAAAAEVCAPAAYCAANSALFGSITIVKDCDEMTGLTT